MGLSAFVTGATGFLGGHLVEALVEAGWSVTALVRDPAAASGLAARGVTPVPGDITDRATLLSGLPQDVDAVFHVAASTSIWSRRNAEQERINVGGTENVIAAAVERGAGRLVHTSSFVVWGFHDTVIDERTPWTDDDEWINYLRTKRLGERRVKAAVASNRLDAVILNPAHILGPGDRHNWSRMIRMVHERRLPGVPPGGGAFADVREVARAHLAAFDRGESGANYLLGGEDVAFLDLVKMIGAALDRPVPDRASPAWQLALAARFAVIRAAFTGNPPDLTPEGAAMICHHLACDSSRAVDALGYRFTPPGALLADTIAWMRGEDMLS